MSLIRASSEKKAGSVVNDEHPILDSVEEILNFDSAAILRNFVHSTPNIPYLYDTSRRKYFFLANQLEETLGYKKNIQRELNRDDLIRLMHPDDATKIDDYTNEVRKRKPGTFLEFEYRLKDQSGNWMWFMCRETIYESSIPSGDRMIFGAATDITNLKSAEFKIRESHANLVSLIESTTDVIYSIDADFRLVSMNTAFRKSFFAYTGMEPKIGMNVLLGLSDPAKTDYFIAGSKRVLAGESVRFTHEYKIEETVKHMDVVYNPVYDDGRNVVGISCFAKDISEIKLAEQTIEQQNDLNKSILENTHCSVFALDRECRYIAFNSLHKNNMKNLFGVDIKTGMNFTELFSDPAEVKSTVQYAKRVLNDESFSITVKVETGSSGIRDYEVSYSPIKNEKDFITGISVFARDITDKIRKQNQLRSIEKQFMDVFENSPDAIFIEDESGTIIDINEAAAAIQGVSRNYLIGNNIRNLVPKEKFLSILRNYKLLFLGAIKRIESSVWSAAHGEVPVEITGKKIPFNNGYALMLVVRDISERKKLEEERAQHIMERGRRQEELMKVSLKIQEEERNRIAAEMHDELGAGLSKISVMCQVIKKNLKKADPVALNVEKILDASEEVQKNISEIIWAMDPEKDTLENLVAYINYFASGYFESGSIFLDIKIPRSIPHVTVIGKIRRNIFLMIKESLNNIIKHADASQVDIDIRFEENILCILIKDNGKGFDLLSVSPFSNGTKNFKRRVAEIDGTINLCTGGNGTTIEFSIPIPVV